MQRKRLRKKLWWVEVIYPLALGAVLFSSLTFIIYSGPKHQRLSSYADQTLLEFTLRGTHVFHRPAMATDSAHGPDGASPIAVISVDNADLAEFGRSPGKEPKPADIPGHIYGDLIKNLMAGNPRLIVFSWLAAAHFEDRVLEQQIADLLRGNSWRNRLLVATPGGKFWTAAEPATFDVELLDDQTCTDVEETQVSCVFFDPDDWIVSGLLENLSNGRLEKDRRFPLTYNLDTIQPSFILNLAPAEELATFSVKQAMALAIKEPQRFQDKIIFIGNSVEQDSSYQYDLRSIIRRVYTVFSDQTKGLRVSGTPFHVFWAQIAHMYLEHQIVAVPPHIVNALLSALLCLFVWGILYVFGSGIALGSFLIFTLFAPLANILSLRYFQVYVPLFDISYFGLSALLFAALGKVSFEVFRRWRISESKKLHSTTADLKRNFTSLFSHNLNTPIAKMKGMLDILAGHGPSLFTDDAREATRIVASMELCARSVLITNSVEDGALNPTALTLDGLKLEFLGLTGPLLERLGLTVTLTICADEEDQQIPFRTDPRVLCTMIGGAAALLASGHHSGSVSISFSIISVQDHKHDRNLAVTVESGTMWLNTKILTLFQDGHIPLVQQDIEQFADILLARLIVQTVRSLDGSFYHESIGEGGKMHFVLPPLP